MALNIFDFLPGRLYSVWRHRVEDAIDRVKLCHCEPWVVRMHFYHLRWKLALRTTHSSGDLSSNSHDLGRKTLFQ